jgi:leucyl aminopeptidase (aminopeptidase T)
MSARGRTPAPEIARAADVLARDYMNVQTGEDVLITADLATDPGLAHALVTAFVPPVVAGAASACAVWIDLTFPYLAGSHVCDAALAGGRVRYLLGGDMGCAGMARLFGGVDLDVYYEVHRAFDEVTAAAIGRPVRITDRRGSDVTFVLAKPGFAKPRRADRPGLYFVPGSCTMFPEPDSVRGVLHVVAAFHEFYTRFVDPISLILDGRIREVSGAGADRVVLDRALRRAAGGEYGHVIHFTHGIHPAARMTGESFIEDMRIIGNNAVGLGIPFWVPGGGENHPDAILTQQSIWIDGQPIVEDGVLVGPSHLAKLGKRLTPRS